VESTFLNDSKSMMTTADCGENHFSFRVCLGRIHGAQRRQVTELKFKSWSDPSYLLAYQTVSSSRDCHFGCFLEGRKLESEHGREKCKDIVCRVTWPGVGVKR
jgi:hypothetical protein